ncbi:hypothetical protein Pmani_017586 [Petrolisthes manimaculis]|uniref:Uncharacterized protein n=1 Tax=Petrolisthes manimaculis TaxID=1843537 RepID=A0AAE1PP49_9EUCA|nr:hypothetical protein Pmani_017586 [Petrolisthes manimaculis]
MMTGGTTLLLMFVIALTAPPRTVCQSLECHPPKPPCELIRCGIPKCGYGTRIQVLPCNCCPSCVPDPGYQQLTGQELLTQQIGQGLGRPRRALRRRVGGAQRLATVHKINLSGDLPPDVLALLKRHQKQMG